MSNGKSGKIHAFQAANINGHLGKRNAFGKTLHPAELAKKMADAFFVKKILGQKLSALQQMKIIFVYKSQNHAFFVAVRTIAVNNFFQISFHLVNHPAAMARSSMFIHIVALLEA